MARNVGQSRRAENRGYRRQKFQMFQKDKIRIEYIGRGEGLGVANIRDKMRKHRLQCSAI